MKTDDSEYILEAINKCNNGGHVIFPQNVTYVIGTALNLTNLEHVDIGKSSRQSVKSAEDTLLIRSADIQAYIQFTNGELIDENMC